MKKDNTLIWLIIGLLGLILIQMYGTLKIKEELKECKGLTTK
jgi:hypothetical protein